MTSLDRQYAEILPSKTMDTVNRSYMQLPPHRGYNQVVPCQGFRDVKQVPWFARPVPDYEDEMYPRVPSKENNQQLQPIDKPSLPNDPRLWSRHDVCSWVCWMCSLHGLASPNTERFLMNGKAVCLMSVSMFTSRVPLGGKLLYRDFQLRLASAMHKTELS